MATLTYLKKALRQMVDAIASSSTQALSDIQYRAGFDILIRDSEWATYENFIIPQLSQLLTPLLTSRTNISVLEIGPGPKSVLGYLPDGLRRKVKRYTAFEPNDLFATELEEWFRSDSEGESIFTLLQNSPIIHRMPFVLEGDQGSINGIIATNEEKYDIVLFCHSMYGMNPKRKFIERALEMLIEQSPGGMVVVFHREANLQFDGLVCHRTASFPTGIVRVPDNNEVLDCFTPFVAGFTMQNADADKSIREEWRKECRALARREESHPNHLLFSSPNIMVAFNRHATGLPELTDQVALEMEADTIKNREARLQNPAFIVRPTDVRQVQECVQWALKHDTSLTVVGGGHSGHCLWPNAVSIDMGAFDRVHVLEAMETEGYSEPGSSPFVVIEAGCKTGEIIRKTKAAGLTVPLGSRPSVGAGLWLQGGIGHLSRLHGLACDSIIGAVMASVDSGQIFCVGYVPSQHQPVGAIRPENEVDLLWAIKGAGTNFGVVISVVFKAYAEPTYLVRNWVAPVTSRLEVRRQLNNFDKLVAKKLTDNCSADVYMYWDAGQLHIGMTMFETSTTNVAITTPTTTPDDAFLGPAEDLEAVDGVELFDTEMYISKMHGGHSSGKTSSFKRCLFLKHIGEASIANQLVAAIESRPSPLCYLHLLHGGGAVSAVAADATAFGCRDWDYACVITGIWPRDQDGTETARSVVRWVYNVASYLLPLSTGVYGADLGPDPRDAALAAKAFGQNRSRLALLKRSLDPHNVLAYACPLPKMPFSQRLVILVTGESCAGKDYCADIWVSVFTRSAKKGLRVRAVSISDATKRQYAAATGADLSRLLHDRAYKEQHRPALTTYFQKQVQQRPRLPEENFQDLVYSAGDVDVLVITGMRDKAPVAALSHLVPESKLLEVHVQASEQTRRIRRGCPVVDNNGNDNSKDATPLGYSPCLMFTNETMGDEAAKAFAERHLLPFLHDNLQRLASMVRKVSDFPREDIEFRHVLGILQQPGGLTLSASLLQSHFTGDWANVHAIASCEVGGLIYASALAARVDLPLILIREAGKLPPPTVAAVKSPSLISSVASTSSKEKRIEMEQVVIPDGKTVVVVDDVLSTGKTLSAVLDLFREAGIRLEDVKIMVVGEFPVHRGRELLRQRGFGNITVQSLLVFSGN